MGSYKHFQSFHKNIFLFQTDTKLEKVLENLHLMIELRKKSFIWQNKVRQRAKKKIIQRVKKKLCSEQEKNYAEIEEKNYATSKEKNMH